MPRFNLRDQDPGVPPQGQPNDSSSELSPPTSRRFGSTSSGGSNTWLIVGAAVAFLALVVVMLNQFHIIHLWGKKSPRVVVSNTVAAPETQGDAPTSGVSTPAAPNVAEPTPLPTEPAKKGTAKKAQAVTEKPAALASEMKQIPATPRTPAGSGAYVIQVASWSTKGPADALAAKLSQKGYPSFVVEGDVNGKTWYRVRVGTFSTQALAADAVGKLKNDGMEGAMVVRH